MSEIELTQGLVALVDEEWLPVLSKFKWYAQDCGWGYYAARDIGGRYSKQHIYMHRYILMAPDDWEVDHINRNKLDNREENLRLLKPSGNKANKAIGSANTSGFKGVSWAKDRGAWVAHIQFERRQYNLGRFATKEDAARNGYEPSHINI